MWEKDRLNLENILEAIQKIETYTTQFHEADEFFEHQLHFDATMMNFIVIGEMVDRLSDEFRSQYTQIEWNKIKGLRNIVAHDYFGIDAEEIWQIAQIQLRKLKTDIHQMLEDLTPLVDTIPPSEG